LSERSALVTSNLDQVKKELRGFTSLHGFSTVLNTSNLFVKGLWVFFFLLLICFLLKNVFENITDYYQYTAITKTENINVNHEMKLPAVTLCLATFYPSFSTNATLADSLLNCTIGETDCGFNDFFSLKIRSSIKNEDKLTCFVLNGGRNSSGHSSEVINTINTGPSSGFLLNFFLPKEHFLYYYINDAFVKPTSSEIIKPISSGTINNFILEKTVETKLEYPFNNCWERDNLPNTPLVRQLSEINITYRQVNCIEVCFQNFVQNYALEHKISEDEAREKDEVKNYDKDKNCSHLCPLECETTQYKISDSNFFLAELIDIEIYSPEIIPQIKEKLNITVNSTEEFTKSYLEISVFFDSLKYTKISQTPKTTMYALISNLGGSTGLFLDLSFMSACRAIEFILGIIFKF